jgi:hypothetical protein
MLVAVILMGMLNENIILGQKKICGGNAEMDR